MFRGPFGWSVAASHGRNEEDLRSEVFETHVRLVGVCSSRHGNCDDLRELCPSRQLVSTGEMV
jgi:hypothetical protein